MNTGAFPAITRPLCGVLSAMAATVRQVPAWRLAATTAVVSLLVGTALLAQVPTAVQLRDWAQTLGPWFPFAFLAAHAVITVFPFPRTAFTLAAGLLFGPWLGIVLAVVASALSAVGVLVLMRVFGWQLSRVVRHPQLESLDARLRERGWPAVVSLRLIPAVPFSVINYAAGASAVRLRPYAVATLVGLLPGTAAVVVLGDALTGDVSPLLFAVSACTAAVGVALLVYEVRLHRHRAKAGPATVLADLAPGQRAIIIGAAPQAPAAVTNRLRQLGFRARADVDVIRRAPLGDPTIYRVQDTELCLRRREAQLIEINLADLEIDPEIGNVADGDR